MRLTLLSPVVRTIAEAADSAFLMTFATIGAGASDGACNGSHYSRSVRSDASRETMRLRWRLREVNIGRPCALVLRLSSNG